MSSYGQLDDRVRETLTELLRFAGEIEEHVVSAGEERFYADGRLRVRPYRLPDRLAGP